MFKVMCLRNIKQAWLDKIQSHDCEADGHTGCQCTWWWERVDQINLELKKEREVWQLN